MTDDPTERFAALVTSRGSPLPLDEASLLIAAHALPGLDVADELGRLDELATGVAEPTLAAVRAHLVDGLGFSGDRVSYHDPRNSLVPQVVNRRLGIPLTLSLIAMEVGRRCALPLVGIGMPGHFLVRDARDDTQFLDLFDDGAVLDPHGCRRIFERLHPGVAWHDAFLDVVDAPAILIRLLTNLAAAYRRSGDRAALGWALGLRLCLPGAGERERRELAVVLTATGRYAEAAAALEGTGVERDRRAAARLRARLN